MQDNKYSNYLETTNLLFLGIKNESLSLDERVEKSSELAQLLILLVNEEKNGANKKRENNLVKVLNTLQGRAIISNLIDQTFRSKSLKTTLNQISHIFNSYDMPISFKFSCRLEFLLIKLLKWSFPKFLKNHIQKKIIKECLHIINFADPLLLKKYLIQNKKNDIIISPIQKPSFGKKTIENHLKNIFNLIEMAHIKSICINISDLMTLKYAGLAHNQLEENLIKIYKKAIAHFQKTKKEKLIILNIENHKDIESTIDVFEKVLKNDEFLQIKTGITLDAYFPEIFDLQKRLTDFAKKRCEKNGKPILIRIVKGFRLNIEQIVSSKNNWPSKTFTSKIETDANFKKMITYGCEIENIKAANIGIVTSNIFDISFALILVKEKSLEPYIYFEIGRSKSTNTIQKALQKLIEKNLKLFCPVVFKNEFHLASGFLLGKINDSSNPENFLSRLDNLFPGTTAWEDELDNFKQSIKFIDKLSIVKKHKIKRNLFATRSTSKVFENEPITDFSIKSNIDWAEEIIEKAKIFENKNVALFIDGKTVFSKNFQIGKNPAYPQKDLYKCFLADETLIETTIKTAKNSEKKYKDLSLEKRCEILKKVSQKIRENRSLLIESLIIDIGKSFFEADCEISDAIDAIEYHINNILDLYSHKNIQFESKGTFLITPAMSFPISTMAEIIACAFLCKNSIIIKPFLESSFACYTLAKLFLEIEPFQYFLQFINYSNDLLEKKLISDPRINSAMIYTSASYAKKLTKLRSGYELLASTGGINSIIVTNAADKEMAISAIIDSAFDFSGQKFSSASTLILEKEIYDDIEFQMNLKDAAENIIVNSAFDLKTTITPLINEPTKELKKALMTLDAAEMWLLQPKQDKKNPNLFSPGIKYGVTQNSSHENYAPLLSVMRANDLDHAIELANSSKFALAAGLFSLDGKEHSKWIDNIEAGNLYINSKITDAKIKRQPFGGYKESAFGPFHKSGGANYLLNFLKLSQISMPTETLAVNDWVKSLTQFLENINVSKENLEIWLRSIANYAYFWQRLKHDLDHCKIIGQDNIHRYKIRENITLRLPKDPFSLDALRVCAAALICSSPIEISWTSSKKLDEFNWIDLLPTLSNIEESENDFLKRVKSGTIARLRLVEPPSTELKTKAAEAGVCLIDSPVLANGRFELLHFLKEQCITYEYHRYGNLGIKESEIRKPLL
ncbi:MAG: 1-pyrroline-5-carboxylate dehydrogenase [Candidatus Anoxychlamydiales bacterium]|nr:1-pyrroline-5-carboxylate dehydrogenase [Candidatus Anoxychlamydiales bacterium]